MTEKGRLTKILLDILDRVKHRGNSTKVNWMNFSNGQAMSRSKFDSIINNYGLPLHDGDLDIIWANIEPNGPNMSYSDFVRFITMDVIDPNKGAKRAPSTARPSPPPQPTYPDEIPTDNYSSRPLSNSGQRQMKTSGGMSGRGMPSQAPPAQPSGNSLLQVLLEYKQQIGNSLLNIDPTFSGFVTAREFEDIIQRIALVNSSEIQRLVSVYDPSNSGFFNYFTLLSDICNQANEQPPIRGGGIGGSSRASQAAYDDYGSPQRRGGGAPPGGYDDFGPPPPRGSGGMGGGQYDDFDLPPRGGPSNYDSYQKPPSRGMNSYDDYGPSSSPQGGQPPRGNSGGFDDYGAPPPSSSQVRNNSGNYGGYDDYGAAPASRSSQSRGSAGGYNNYDDYGSAPAASPSAGPTAARVDEIIEKIASRMDNVYDSSQSCFQKWRSYSRVLGAQEFVTGARKDFQIDLTQEEAAAVIAKYTKNGYLSMGEFLKMVGAGSDMIREQRRQEAAVALTEEEKVLQHVARQAKNKEWRVIFEQCDSVERTVQSLRTINIYVMLNDLRPCFTKWGKDGVIKKIQAFIDSQ